MFIVTRVSDVVPEVSLIVTEVLHIGAGLTEAGLEALSAEELAHRSIYA